MKSQLMVAFLCIAQFFSMQATGNGSLHLVETDAQKNMQAFNDLSRSINMADLSESIVSDDAHALKDALHDVMELNRMVNSQVNASIQLWNMYLDSVKVPSMETYLLGQVMNSLITTIRALTLRSSVDQSMILSLVKKHFNDTTSSHSDFNHGLDMRDTRVENTWRSLRQE